MIEYHRELIADEPRTTAYRDAIRAVVKPGDVVVDIGCGSGILSFFACEAGASHVYAIDSGHPGDIAALLAPHLGFGDRMTVFHDHSSRVELPQKADVLITETMGVLAFDENILGATLDARKRLLREGATIVPRRLQLMMMPVSAPAQYERHIEWWSQPRYGFDLSPLRVFASNSIGFVKLEQTDAIADASAVLDVELATHQTTIVEGLATFVADRDATLHGFGAWFIGTLAEGVLLETRDTTEWLQAFFPLEVPVQVTAGSEITLGLETFDGTAWRWRGKAAGVTFDQANALAMPPCAR